jgi:ArsR family metal-binding transcriptional regulator
MLLRSYHFDLFAPPCAPGAERWSAKAALDDDIGDALPYLNATIKRAIYNHAARALTWRMGGHTISVRPREIAISNLFDKDAAAIEM